MGWGSHMSTTDSFHTTDPFRPLTDSLRGLPDNVQPHRGGHPPDAGFIPSISTEIPKSGAVSMPSVKTRSLDLILISSKRPERLCFSSGAIEQTYHGVEPQR